MKASRSHTGNPAHQIWAKKARRQQARADSLRRTRDSSGLWNMGRYYWKRNFYPILTSLLSKTLLLVEIVLLAQFFSLSTAGFAAALIFALACLRQAYQGFLQPVRIGFTESRLMEGRKDQRQWVSIGLSLAFLTGLAVSTLLLVLASQSETAYAFGFFLVYAIIFPLDLYASTQWVLVYTERRLRRRFGMVVFCRCLPVLFLLLFWQTFGALAYPLGLLLGHGSEALYLSRIAGREIEESVLEEKCSGLWSLRALLKVPWWNRYRSYVSFWFIPPAYALLMLGLLSSSREGDWLKYFAFLTFLSLWSFLPQRAAQSLSMDVFLALRSGNIYFAKMFRAKTERFIALLLVLVSVALFLLSYFLAPYLYLWSQRVFDLLPLIFPALWIHSFYLAEMQFLRSACQERRYFFWPVALIFTGMAVGQLLLFSNSADLGSLLLFELLCTGMLALALLRDRKMYESSPILSMAQRERNRLEGLLLPRQWAREQGEWRRKKYLICQIDPHYRRKDYVNALVEQWKNCLGSELCASGIRPGWVLISLQSELEASDIAEKLRKDFSAFLQVLIPVAEETSARSPLSLTDMFARIRDTFRLTREFQKDTRFLLLLSQESSALPYLREAQEFLRQESSTESGKCEFPTLFEKYLLDKFSALQTPRVYCQKNGRRRVLLKAPEDCLRFSEKLFGRALGEPWILPRFLGSYLPLQCWGRVYGVLCLRNLSQAERQDLSLRVLTWTIALHDAVLREDHFQNELFLGESNVRVASPVRS